MLPPPPKVLVVEDDWLVAEDIALQLGDLGFRAVGPAATVADALRLVATERLDAACLDLDLRSETSWPVAEALAARGTPFLILSGRMQPEIPARFAGTPVLGKPFMSRELAATLGRLLETARS